MESIQKAPLINHHLIDTIDLNLQNAFSKKISEEEIEKICFIFNEILNQPTSVQEKCFQKALVENQKLTTYITYVSSRLIKYGDSSNIAISSTSFPSSSIEKSWPWYILSSLSTTEQLKSYRNYNIKNKQVSYSKEHLNLDSSKLSESEVAFYKLALDDEIRQVQNFTETLFQLSNSVWIAEQRKSETRSKRQFIWRARVMADQYDVYQILRFILQNKPSDFQSLHINTGTHGDFGQGVEQKQDVYLSDKQISKETKNNVVRVFNELGLGSDISEQYLSIYEANTKKEGFYPEEADHVLDTLCQGAFSPLKIDKEYLPFLSEKNRDYSILSKQVLYEKGSYLGDGRTRFVQKYYKNERLFELFKSIWVAEKTPENRYVWRARVMVDNVDVFKLMKFLMCNNKSSVIHINTGSFGFEGKTAFELKDKSFESSKIKEKVEGEITNLKLNKKQLKLIKVNTITVNNPSIYPINADHIVDTVCEGAKSIANGPGLTKPLMFLTE